MNEPFVRSGNRHRPLSEARARAARFAGALQDLGIGHGDRYAIVMRNEISYLEANLGAAAIGAVPVPVNWHWTGTDLEHLLTDSGSKVAVVHSDLIPAVEAHMPPGMRIVEAGVPAEIREVYGLGDVPLTGRHPVMDDLIDQTEPAVATDQAPPLAVIYTSGTTGLAKGILRDPVRPEAVPGMMRSLSDLFGLQPGYTTVLPAPLYHSAPNINMISAAALGMNIIIMPRFDAEEFLRLVDRYHVDSVQMVPTMFVRMLRLPKEVRDKYDVSSLKSVVHAAAPCPPDVKRAMIDWFGPIVKEYYGGSEGGAWVQCTTEEWLAHPGTVGKPAGGAAIRILGPDRQELPVGETGVIYGRPADYWPDFTYLNDDAKRREIDGGDGFITVGDVGRVDEDGYLYLSDRLNDMVISGV
ncbi:AMP-binding protein [Thermocatellispora tengchongensis]|uniref:AMP-binding protein n=1 Tax=Thermocatellispora tengchongensis TaxID=1073253 RepID=UPI003633EED5